MMINLKIMPAIRIMLHEPVDTSVNVDGNTLKHVLDQLADTYGAPFEKWVYHRSENKVRDAIMIMVNGRHLRYFSSNLNLKLNDGDTVAISLPIAGG